MSEARQPVLRRPRPPQEPQEPQEPAFCGSTIKLWLTEQDYFDRPALTGYCSQHGVTVRQAGQQDSVLMFYDDEELTELITVRFSEVKFFRVVPLTATDESPT